MTAEPDVDPDNGPALRGTDIRLVPLAVSAWGGTLAGLAPSAGSAILSVGCLLVVIGTVFLLGRGHGALIVAGLCALVALSGGMLGHLSMATLRQSPLAQAPGGSEVSLIGTVSSELNPQTTSWGKDSWSVQIAPTSGGRVTAMVDVSALNGVPLIRGSVVRLEGKLDKPENVVLPSLGYLRVSNTFLIKDPPSWQRWVSSLKSNLSALTTQKAGAVGPLIGGMAIGDDRGLDKPLKDAMLTTSLTHLSAVSGSHIAISLSVINVLLPGRRSTKAAFTWGFLVLIVAVVGPEPAVVRAVAMGGLAAWGLTIRRGGQPLVLLSAVTTVTVLVDPWSALSLGFALSTIATAGILTLGRSGTRWSREAITDSAIPEQLQSSVRAVAEAVIIAVVAQAVTLPILALVNPWLPTWGVVANLLVAPIVTPLTLLGLAATVTCLWWPGAAETCVALAAPLARYMGTIALHVANWPLAQLPWPHGLPGLLLALAIALATAAAASAFIARTNGSPIRRGSKRRLSNTRNPLLGRSGQS